MDVRVIHLSATFSLLLASCGAGTAGSTSFPTGGPTYIATLTVASAPNVLPVPATSPIVLYDGQFLDAFHSAVTLVADITPSPAQTPSVVWTSSNANIVVQQQDPRSTATAPPGGTFAAIGSAYGTATVTAQISAPLNQTLSILIYHYPSLSLGCRFRYAPAFNFDAGSTASGTSSDLYATFGSDQIHQLDPCANSVFVTSPGTPEVWHTPYGGVFLSGLSLAQFPSIQASQWQNAGTQFSPQSGVLVFKTQGGLIVKASVPIGPYEVSNGSGQFPY